MVPLSIAAQVHARSTLELGEGVTLLAHNGKLQSVTDVVSNAWSLPLSEGLNQILIEYTAEIMKGGDTELESTQPAVMLFEATGDELILSAPRIKSDKEFSRFMRNQKWLLTNKQGKQVGFKAEWLKKNGFQLGRDLERELHWYNQTSGVAAQRQNDALHTQQGLIKPREGSFNNMAHQMLIYWYQQADENTKEYFRKLINN